MFKSSQAENLRNLSFNLISRSAVSAVGTILKMIRKCELFIDVLPLIKSVKSPFSIQYDVVYKGL